MAPEQEAPQEAKPEDKSRIEEEDDSAPCESFLILYSVEIYACGTIVV